MPQLIRLNGILAKIEGTYLTDPTPVVATDGIQVEEAVADGLVWGYLEENLRENLAGTFLGRAGTSKPTGRWAELEITTVLKGFGAAYSASDKPECGVLLRACGLAETVDASPGTENVVYVQRSGSFESCTIYAYTATKLYNINGCMGSVRFVLTPGQHPRAVFSMRGYLSAVTEVALPTIEYPGIAITPPTVKGAGLTLNSVDPPGFDDFELNMNTEVVERPHGNATNGHAGYYIVDHDPRISTTIEQVAISTFDPWTLRDTPTLFAWDIGPVGPAQYNRFTLAGPKGRILDHSLESSDGIASGALEIRCQHTDEETEDAVTLTFD